MKYLSTGYHQFKRYYKIDQQSITRTVKIDVIMFVLKIVRNVFFFLLLGT